MTSGPSSAVVAVTLRCNSRCRMCAIWEAGPTAADLPIDLLGRLPPSLRQVNLSGGEPYLRDDLARIVGAVRAACPRARLVLNTNGLLPRRVRALTPALLAADPRLAVRVSIDGRQATHDRIRGVPGGHERSLESLSALKDAGARDIGIFMTVWSANVSEIGDVADLAEEKKVEFGLGLSYPSPIFFGEKVPGLDPADRPRLASEMGRLARRERARLSPKRWARAWFALRLRDFALEGRRAIPCGAGRDFLYLDPAGTVFACHLTSHRMGSLAESSWEEVSRSAEADEARRSLAGCNGCWMVCTLAGAGFPRSAGIALRAGLGRLRASRPTDR